MYNQMHNFCESKYKILSDMKSTTICETPIG